MEEKKFEMGETIGADAHMQPLRLIEMLLHAMKAGKVLVVLTQDAEIYRLSLGLMTAEPNISKWRGERWSKWYDTKFDLPGLRYGIRSSRWHTAPLIAWAMEDSAFAPPPLSKKDALKYAKKAAKAASKAAAESAAA